MIYLMFLLMDEFEIFVYLKENFIVEKFEVMIIFGEFNSWMKDFYDFYFIFMSDNFIDLGQLEVVILVIFDRR